MRKRDLTQFGIKWNPFSPDVPPEALMRTPKTDLFCWRVEQQLQEGGFILLTGDPGTGKSILLRQLAHHLTNLSDVLVGVLSRPQSVVGDFYRELGHLFGVPLSPANRYGGFKALRERWQAHIETAMARPILLYDEAQLANHAVLSELRLLTSTQFDSSSILTVVLCGDDRLLNRLRSEELLPLESRIRFRMPLEAVSKEQLTMFVGHCLEAAGNQGLMTKAVIGALAEHAGGNFRSLTNLANELLNAAIRKDVALIDEKLFFETLGGPTRGGEPREHKRPAKPKPN
ncbi:MAG: AAA family ATPase [Candidatus Riflebacteria bacterium]|nr:AAA family ATPase [Candidatus Riflebacteria bacterium]